MFISDMCVFVYVCVYKEEPLIIIQLSLQWAQNLLQKGPIQPFVWHQESSPGSCANKNTIISLYIIFSMTF